MSILLTRPVLGGTKYNFVYASALFLEKIVNANK